MNFIMIQKLKLMDLTKTQKTAIQKMHNLLQKKTKDIKNETVSFWLKICRGSFMSGTIFDPSTISSEELKRYDNYTGQNKYSYKKVSEECFNHYISYLTTKKTSFLRNAQRGLIS